MHIKLGFFYRVKVVEYFSKITIQKLVDISICFFVGGWLSTPKKHVFHDFCVLCILDPYQIKKSLLKIRPLRLRKKERKKKVNNTLPCVFDTSMQPMHMNINSCITVWSTCCYGLHMSMLQFTQLNVGITQTCHNVILNRRNIIDILGNPAIP